MDKKITYQQIGNMLDELAEIGRTSDGGITRFSFTDDDVKAREKVISWMNKCGMTVLEDAVGNIIGRIGPKDKPAIALGSHIDSVPNGGKYDGPLGVTTAIAVVEQLIMDKVEFNSPVEIIVFSDEEGARFGGGLFGSKAMTGILDEDSLDRKDANGISARDALTSYGYDPNNTVSCIRKAENFKVYFEVHIEQAHVLEENNLGVGIVKGIAGPVHFLAEFIGRADHAGATPMNLRRDSLLAACEVAVETEKIAKKAGDTTVATVGRIDASPGATNVIAGKTIMSFDVRDIVKENRDNAVSSIKDKISEVAKARELKVKLTPLSNVPPVILNDYYVKLCEDTASENNINTLTMISGAAHDAMNMTRLTDVVMLFVKSVGGLSHCPEEYSKPEDIEEAANLLYYVVKKLVKE